MGKDLSNTRVGWVLSGPVKIESKHTLASVNFVATHVLKVGADPIDSSLEQNVPVENFDLTLSGPGGGSEARMAKLTAANQKPLIL